jgi:hypothetical protein
VHNNVVTIIKALISAAQSFGFTFDADSLKLVREIEGVEPGVDLTPELAKSITQLWQTAVIQKTFRRNAEFQLSVATQYFMDNLDRLAANDYAPTDEDILRVRAKTTGITEISFVLSDIRFRLVDVGGQRSERKKWMHCFEDVSAILFVVATSEYDLMLYEDQVHIRVVCVYARACV